MLEAKSEDKDPLDGKEQATSLRAYHSMSALLFFQMGTFIIFGTWSEVIRLIIIQFPNTDSLQH